MKLKLKNRRPVCVLLLISLVISLCGCGGAKNAPEAAPSPEPTPEPAPAEVQAGPIDARVFFDRNARLFTDPQGHEKTIFAFSVDTPVIFIDGNEAAAEKINAFMAKLDEKEFPGENGSSTEMDAMTYYLSLAEDCYTAYAGTELEDSCSFSYIRTARVVRCDSLLTEYEYSLFISSPDGVEHETNRFFFDSATGDAVDPETVTNEKYPPYSAPGEGYVGVFQMGPSGDGSFSVADMIEADENGDDYLIQAIGEVDGLEINEVFYNADCTDYTLGRCLYYRTRLKDEGIQLRCFIPEGVPDLEVRFNMHGRSVGNVLTYDGQTGAIALKITENPYSAG